MVWLHILHVAHGINEAIGWVCGDRHYTLIDVDKESEGTPLTWVTPSFRGVARCFQVNLYVRHKVENLFWGIEAGLDVADYESYVYVGDLLMLLVHLEDKENGCNPAELKGALCHRRHKCTLCDEFLQVVKGNALHVEGVLCGAEVDVPQVETFLAVESVPRYGTLAGGLQEYPVEVECGHLKEQAGGLL